MANKAKNSDEMKAVCRQCQLDGCVADLAKGAAALRGCQLAGVVTTDVWRSSPHYSHQERAVDEDSPDRGLDEYHVYSVWRTLNNA